VTLSGIVVRERTEIKKALGFAAKIEPNRTCLKNLLGSNSPGSRSLAFGAKRVR
jgi:hypothetical protein